MDQPARAPRSRSLSGWRAGDVAFVGRDEELAALDAALDRAVRFKAPQGVTVLGPLGAGKSRLIEHWLASRAGGGALRVARAVAMAPVEGQMAPPRSVV